MLLCGHLKKRKHGLTGIVFCFLLFNWGCDPEYSDSATIIEDGAYVNALPVEKSWKSKDGAVSGHGLYNLLYAYQYVHDADFRMEATISLDKVDSTTAIFLLFNNHFGFDSKADEHDTPGNFFFYSPDLKRYERFDKARKHITPGRSFVFEVSRKDTLFEIAIDKTVVASIPLSWVSPPYEGYLAFRPWLNTIHVYDWRLEGKLSGFEKPEFVFQAGEADYACFRIPAIIKTKDNTLLAFAEGRRDECWSDSGDTDIVMKRSEDGGKTWSRLEIVWDDGPHACHAPTPIVDAVNQRVVLVASRSLGSDHFKKFRAGKNEDIRRAFVLHADLDGKNWSQPLEITQTAIPKNAWWFGPGPGSAIQLRSSPYRGRLAAGATYIEKETNDYYSMAIFSDDYGFSWQAGNPVPLEGGNESEIVEFPSGQLMINSRNYSLIDLAQKRGAGQVSYRIVALSEDGGLNWTDARRDSALIEPVCQASLLYVDAEGEKDDVLLFSNPPSAKERINLSVRASLDEGQTWPYLLRLYEGPSAYSDLVDLGNGEIGCLFECGNVHAYEGLAFRKYQMEEVKGS